MADPLYLAPGAPGVYLAEYAQARPAGDGLSVVLPLAVGSVPTLEATHTWDDTIVLHDHREFGEQPWRLRCREIKLRSMADPVLPADPRVGGTGTIGRPGRRGGKTVTYAGAIEAVDAAALRDATDALEAACWSVRDDRTVLIEQDDAAWTFQGRAHATVADNTSLSLSAVPTPYQAEFVVAVQMNDPRVYSAGQFVDESVLAMTASPVRLGLPWPRLPVVLRPAPSLAIQSTVEILGRVDTGITLRVHGPCSTPTLIDVDRDVRLILDVVLHTDDWIDVDLRAATVTDNAGDDASAAIRWPESTWWAAPLRDVRPGPLNLRVEFEDALPPARVDVLHYPAFP
jgi:hypothetical protein